MTYFMGVLVVSLACLIVGQSLPLSQIKDANDYRLAFYFNTTTSVFNGTDVRNPLTRSEMEVAVHTNKPQQLSATADALKKQIASIPSACQIVMPQVATSNVDNKPLPLVFSYNKTALVDIGPKHESSAIYVLKLNVFARK